MCLYEFVLFVGNSTVKMRMKESEMCLANDNRDLRNDQYDNFEVLKVGEGRHTNVNQFLSNDR